MIARPVASPKGHWGTPLQNRRSGFTLIELLVVIAIVAAMIALLIPATRQAREPARRSTCKNNLKQIGLALHNYVETYGALPPAYTIDANGKPLHSWRTLILPFVDEAPLYAKIDLTQPWDDPTNAEAAKAMPHVFGCPSVDAPLGMTTYLAAAGPGSCLQPGQPRPFSNITDGLSNTLMVIEVSKPQAVHWMSPQDADETLILSLGKAAKDLNHTGGMHGLMADGSVRFVSASTSAADLRAIFSVAGKDAVSGQF